MAFRKAPRLILVSSFLLLLGPSCTSGDKESSSTDKRSEVSDDAGTDAGEIEKFSFFVTSVKALQELSGSENGFGGDLRFGETGPGAGLRGADKICTAIAERSMPNSSSKVWRAFLSATADENGNQVNAIDRIGEGPWYDRIGRVFALTKEDLLFTRPQNGDPAIVNDFPNEDGIPNHQPDPTQPQVDNHDMLTGSNEKGELYSPTATCKDWTSSEGSESDGRPRVGHSWPRIGSTMGSPGADGGMPNFGQMFGADGGMPDFGQMFGADGGMPNFGQMFGADGGMPDFTNILGGNIDACGCVDENDQCHVGISNAHCGADGIPCVACAEGTSCLNGVCDTTDGGTTDFGGIFSGNVGDMGGMMGSMNNWISSLDEAGCAPGVHLMERGGPLTFAGENNVGSGGGYGGFYCFALTP